MRIVPLNRVWLGLVLLAAGSAGVALVWRSIQGDEAGDGMGGWPERLEMVCGSCGEGFEVGARDYLESIQSVGEGGGSRLACPRCEGRQLRRADHPEHRGHRFDVPEDPGP